MNRLQLAMLIVGSVQASIGFVLAAAGFEPPLYPVPGLILLVLGAFNAALVFVMASLPSWKESGMVTRTMDRMSEERARGLADRH